MSRTKLAVIVILFLSLSVFLLYMAMPFFLNRASKPTEPQQKTSPKIIEHHLEAYSWVENDSYNPWISISNPHDFTVYNVTLEFRYEYAEWDEEEEKWIRVHDHSTWFYIWDELGANEGYKFLHSELNTTEPIPSLPLYAYGYTIEEE